MESIGDNSYVKNMLDQVSLQQESITNMNDSSKVLKDSINNISQAMGDKGTIHTICSIHHRAVQLI